MNGKIGTGTVNPSRLQTGAGPVRWRCLVGNRKSVAVGMFAHRVMTGRETKNKQTTQTKRASSQKTGTGGRRNANPARCANRSA